MRRGKAAPAALRAEDYTKLAQFRYALRRFLRFSERAAGQVGLTGQQYQAMLIVRSRAEDEPITIAELARELLVRHHSAVGLVDRLVAHGHLVRDRASKDHRKVQVRLTPKGERELGRLASIHRRKLHRITPDIFRALGALTGAWRGET
jgi:DNA-binding MarR family transcriptional regulator